MAGRLHIASMALAAVLVSSQGATAHVFAPALFSVQESGPGRADVRWKQPLVRTRGSELRPILPDSCAPVGEAVVEEEGTGIVTAFTMACREGLVGHRIGVKGIAQSGANVLLRVELADGRAFRQVLTPDTSEYVIPEQQGVSAVAADYIGLGFDHILSGFDHLAFVLGLVLLVGIGRNLLWTITAFTVGHSLTLALAVLGVVSIPQRPVEVAIAASIYFLAFELTRRRATRQTWMERAPWLVAGSFGLLHGLGFAGALNEVGLPPGDIPLALLSFNVGIEAGQLTFVAVVIPVQLVLQAAPVVWPRWMAEVPAYGIGALSVYWIFERVAGILPSQV